jgi:hypothetical protein
VSLDDRGLKRASLAFQQEGTKDTKNSNNKKNVVGSRGSDPTSRRNPARG